MTWKNSLKRFAGRTTQHILFKSRREFSLVAGGPIAERLSIVNMLRQPDILLVQENAIISGCGGFKTHPERSCDCAPRFMLTRTI